MHVVVTPIGTGGDVLPLVGIGRALARRGHAVTVLANRHFEPLARAAGLAFDAVGEAADYLRVLEGPLVADPRRGIAALMRYVVGRSRTLYEAIASLRRATGPLALVTPPLGFGARVAGERLALPTATVYLAPAALQSAHDPPVQVGVPNARWMPGWYKRSVWWAVDRLVLDRAVAPTVNALRRELGLAPARRFFEEGWDSPRPFLGLFPDWFAPRQPDWPRRYVATGFPLYDDDPDADAEVTRFLDEGEPPLVFTPGSGNLHAHAFFAAAVEVSRRLGRRALLLTRFSAQLPSELPAGVRHFAYAPLSRVLPRAAALVHHGGIGTAAQGLAAGVPQLVMPIAYDQPDNAARLARLGVAAVLPPRRFRGPAVAAALDGLLASPEVAARCRATARRGDGFGGVEAACARLEEALA
jgi:UDP:flavonoid glycosyltransferase YjiC (YdhE family)